MPHLPSVSHGIPIAAIPTKSPGLSILINSLELRRGIRQHELDGQAMDRDRFANLAGYYRADAIPLRNKGNSLLRSVRMSNLGGTVCRKTGNQNPGRAFLKRLACMASLALVLLGSSGCTAIFAAAGAVVDSVVITSPLWGPSVFERGKLDKAQDAPLVSLSDEIKMFASNSTLTSGDSFHVGVRLLDGSESPREPHYFSWLSAVPLLPYTRTDCFVTRSRGTVMTQDYMAYGSRILPVSFPLSRIPERMRPGQDSADMIPPCRETVENLIRGELAARPPSTEDLTVALWAAQSDKTAFQLTHLVYQAMENQFGKGKVLYELPDLTGGYRFPGFSGTPPAMVMGNECLVNLNPFEYQIVGRTLGYPEITKPHVSVSGRIVDLRVEKSQVCYGLTLVGANLLGWLGAPLSSNRLVIKFEVMAHQKPGNFLLLIREYELATERQVVSVYYGGDFAQDANTELAIQIAETMKDFARELAELAPVRGLTASTDAVNQATKQRQ